MNTVTTRPGRSTGPRSTLQETQAPATSGFADTAGPTRPPGWRHSSVGERTQAAVRPGDAGSPSWCLRFLSGALRGRTFGLKAGANTLGSASDCELLLPGSDAQPRHLVFSVGELVVSVQKVGTAVVVLNGKEMQYPRKSVVAGDVIRVGQIEFQLDQVYPVEEPDDSMFAGPMSRLPGDDALGTPRRHARSPLFWGGAALVLLAAGGLVALAIWSRQAVGPAADAAVDLGEVEQVLAVFPETEVQALPGGHFNVKGYVETRQRRQALRDALARFGRRVSVNVHAAEDMVEQARRYVSDPAIAIVYRGQGRLEVSGTVDDETVRGKLARLSEDLYPTVQVSDKVQYVPRPVRPRAVQEEQPRESQQSWQRLLPSPLVSITQDEDGLSHIQLANGTRYYEGAVLRTGVVLAHIGPDRVTVRGLDPPP